jgi:hypothetical protein
VVDNGWCRGFDTFKCIVDVGAWAQVDVSPTRLDVGLVGYRLLMSVTLASAAMLALAGCGLSAPLGRLSGAGAGKAGGASVSAPPPFARPARPLVFEGTLILGQRSLDSESADDLAAYHYRLRYSLDSLETTQAVDPDDDLDHVRVKIVTSATVFVTNMSGQHSAPFGDLRGVMLGGVYTLDREICQQRQVLIAGRGNYCFVGLWASPEYPGLLAAGETRKLGDGTPVQMDIGPLTKKVADGFMKDLLSPNFYFVAILSNGSHLVPQNHCILIFNLTNGNAIIDTQPHVNVCNSEGGQ